MTARRRRSPYPTRVKTWVSQPQVGQAVGWVLEQVVAVDEQQRELDVGRPLAGFGEPVAGEAGRSWSVGHGPTSKVTIQRQLLDALCYRLYVRQLSNPLNN